VSEVNGSDLSQSDPLDDIGTRVRELRLASGLSMRAVAEKAEVTASFVSQLERGLVQPSIQTLRRICDVLGTSLVDALSPRQSSTYVTRKDERHQVIVPSRNFRVEQLVGAHGRPFDFWMVHLAPNSATAPDPIAHDAREALYVVKGRATFENSEGVVDLEEGDTIYFHSQVAHRIVNPGDDELTFLSCIVGTF
jgi:transcriptional regulator with XRE-family HTH domain